MRKHINIFRKWRNIDNIFIKSIDTASCPLTVQYYGWPKWTKSAKGSKYEKFHVRKHTRIKSFVYKTIRVSKVSCIKWYAYQKLRERFHTCMFKDQSKLPIPYTYVFIRVTFNTRCFYQCKINNVLLLQRVWFLTCMIYNAYLLIHESIFNHWRRIYTYEKRYTYRNSRVQINSR